MTGLKARQKKDLLGSGLIAAGSVEFGAHALAEGGRREVVVLPAAAPQDAD